MILLPHLFVTAGILAQSAVTIAQDCKTTPHDAEWPSIEKWSALNSSIDGTLLKTSPVASVCYPNMTVTAQISCDTVKANWMLPTFHAALPESIDYPFYANNSCLPPGAPGFTAGKGCSIGALPQYIVNATTEEQIARALVWAKSHNMRVVIKGTGHDMNGRSSGAYSLLIWTRNFRNLTFNSAWPLPGSNSTSDVVIAGSGNNWGIMYTAADAQGKAVVGGEARSVGLGGFIQGGGHGPLSSHYGLAADQILQATIVTVSGEILTVNVAQNQDLYWAIRGGGAGQYGVVTEFVLKVYTAPRSIVVGTLSFSSNGTTNSSIMEAWKAFAVDVQSLPDLMDAGLSGSIVAQSKRLAGSLALNSFGHVFYGFDMSAATMTSILNPVITQMRRHSSSQSFTVTWTEPLTFANYTTFFNYFNQDAATGAAGVPSLMSSRLLGRKELTESITKSKLVSFLQRALTAEDPTKGTSIIIGMQGGKGPSQVPEENRGALHSSWRTAYIHLISLGATINATADPQTALSSAGKWVNENKETLWQEWAPEMGAYMNEANPFNPHFKADYYGASYERLLEIKNKYDPTGSLFGLTGVNSDAWNYNLNTGKLCRV